MLYVTYRQEGVGRSGHAFSDIFSAYIYGFLLEAKVLYDPSWDRQSIITSSSFQKNSASFTGGFDQVVEINNLRVWAGLNFKQFSKVRKRILGACPTGSDKDVLVVLGAVCKIHPNMVFKWYKDGLIDSDLYTEKIIPVLRQLYYEDHPDGVINDTVGIHIRRGDWCVIHKKRVAKYFNFEYYESIIQKVHDRFPHLKFRVFCENENYDDIVPLQDLPNTELFIGGESEVSDHFNQLCRCEILIPTTGFFSTAAAYLTEGKGVFVSERIKKAQPNAFNCYTHGVPNFHISNSVSGMVEGICAAMGE
ncbi:alpha-1,2-fucosyltransferase [Verrucomicrobiales bacterium]|nr:alpha-1,2-fucosyltransferase [Verrucomicrobiales bacterium]MDB4358910.1 alpha-1,2-fucosyltransferase [Verrucomicrobiales bacterium]